MEKKCAIFPLCRTNSTAVTIRLYLMNETSQKWHNFNTIKVLKSAMQKSNHRIVKFLQENNLTIAFAESVTCGLAVHQLSAVKGTSKVLEGSIVCYDEIVKRDLLKVPQSLLDKF